MRGAGAVHRKLLHPNWKVRRGVGRRLHLSLTGRSLLSIERVQIRMHHRFLIYIVVVAHLIEG